VIVPVWPRRALSDSQGASGANLATNDGTALLAVMEIRWKYHGPVAAIRARLDSAKYEGLRYKGKRGGQTKLT